MNPEPRTLNPEPRPAKCPIYIYNYIILIGYINILLVVFEVCS
jgi:hypothetical protein